jgi:hypothetical protein
MSDLVSRVKEPFNKLSPPARWAAVAAVVVVCLAIVAIIIYGVVHLVRKYSGNDASNNALVGNKEMLPAPKPNDQESRDLKYYEKEDKEDKEDKEKEEEEQEEEEEEIPEGKFENFSNVCQAYLDTVSSHNTLKDGLVMFKRSNPDAFGQLVAAKKCCTDSTKPVAGLGTDGCEYPATDVDLYKYQLNAKSQTQRAKELINEKRLYQRRTPK